MTSLARALELVAELATQGVRGYVDPQLVAPPCVLITPPNLEFDLNCAVTASWQLVCIAPTATSFDRNAWTDLDALVADVGKTSIDVIDATSASYVVNGKTYPAYILTSREAIEWP